MVSKCHDVDTTATSYTVPSLLVALHPPLRAYRASIAHFSIRHGDDSVGMFLSYFPRPSFRPLVAELTLSYLLPSPSDTIPSFSVSLLPRTRHPFSFVYSYDYVSSSTLTSKTTPSSPFFPRIHFRRTLALCANFSRGGRPGLSALSLVRSRALPRATLSSRSYLRGRQRKGR